MRSLNSGVVFEVLESLSALAVGGCGFQRFADVGGTDVGHLHVAQRVHRVVSQALGAFLPRREAAFLLLLNDAGRYIQLIESQ